MFRNPLFRQLEPQGLVGFKSAGSLASFFWFSGCTWLRGVVRKLSELLKANSLDADAKLYAPAFHKSSRILL